MTSPRVAAGRYLDLLEAWFLVRCLTPYLKNRSPARQVSEAVLESHLPSAQISYWNEQGRHEVDFVIESEGKVYAIEVKAATKWSDRDLSG